MSSAGLQHAGSTTQPTIVVSRNVDLQDILCKQIPGTVGISIHATLSKQDAKILVTAIHTLSTKIEDLSKVSLIVLCQCPRNIGSTILRGLKPVKGLKNIALRLNDQPGPICNQAEKTAVELTHNEPPFRFAELPAELRQEILSYCLQPPEPESSILISPDLPKRKYECCRKCLPLSALNQGHCACSTLVGGHSTTCKCKKHTFASFRVSKALYMDSTVVCFANNRFVLHGNPESLRFLQWLPYDALHALRKVDILVKQREFHMYATKVPDNFDEIICIIVNHCNLSALHVSLDTGPEEEGEHFTYKPRSWYSYDIPGEWLFHPIKNIVRAMLPLEGIKSFEIFLPDCPELEVAFEQWLMGDDYNSYKNGKISFSYRDTSNPHQVLIPHESDEMVGYVTPESSVQYLSDTDDSAV